MMDRQTSSAISFARSPRSRTNRAGDLEWIMESLHFAGELGEVDQEAIAAVESEPLARLMQVQGDWERQISDVVADFLDTAQGPQLEVLNKLAQFLDALGCYGPISVATHTPPPENNPASFSPFVSNSFLVVRPPGVAEPILVDPWFRDKFAIARPSPEYKALMEDSVPVVAVGSLRKIRVVVSILSERMARSFHAMGQFLPPWRRLQVMLSLWPKVLSEEAPPPVPRPPSRLPLALAPEAAYVWQHKAATPAERGCVSGQLGVALAMANRAARAG
eukprot:jgi/Mesvir1/7847/Mv11781-RA.1